MTFDDRIADWNTICDQRDSVPNLIGQDRVKSQLNFHFKGYLANGIMPSIMFTAPRGCGKTMIATALASLLKVRDTNKRKIIFNCSQLRNLRQFWNEIVIPHIHDKDCTVIFDEASEHNFDLQETKVQQQFIQHIHLKANNKIQSYLFFNL